VSAISDSSEKSRRQDVIVITGKPEDCEAAKAALMVNSNSCAKRLLV